MISSKILVQSAAAGLMAGAILATPLLVFELGDDAATQASTPESSQVRMDWDYRSAPAFRAAPSIERQPTRIQREQTARSIEQRNEAARVVLGEINHAYGKAQAEQAGQQAAHEFTVRTMAAQTARMVENGSYGHTHGHAAALRVANEAMYRGDLQRLRAMMRQQVPLGLER